MLARSICMICVLAFLAGCGSGGGGSVPLGIGTGGNRDGRIELRVAWPGIVSKGKLIPAAAEKMDVTVTGEGLSSPLIQSVLKSQVQNGQVTVSFSDVPVGYKTVEVRALSSAVVTVAHRTATFSVQENQTATVTTELGVSITDGLFIPFQFALARGETLLWVNGGYQSHTVAADNGLFNSGTLAPGESSSWTATTPGTIAFHCGIHPNEIGTLTVQFPPPLLSSFSPTAGPAGTPLTITGSNFGAQQLTGTVTVGGVAAPVSSWSDTQITCTIPSGTGATDGVVQVTVAGVPGNAGKFVATPTVEWTQTQNGPSSMDDRGQGITIDSSGNVLVTGYETRAGEWHNIWIRKYDPAGAVLWTDTYNGLGNNEDEGAGVAVDSAGNVFVAGYDYPSGLQQENIWVRKYTTAGGTVWTRTFNLAPSDDVDQGRGIAVDSAGNACVVGHVSRVTPTIEWDNIWVRKYDSINGGNTLWTQTYNSPANSFDKGYGIAIDGLDNIYVTGSENRTDLGQGANVWLRKYSSAGNTLWTWTYNGPANGGDEGIGIAADEAGNVYVTGYENRADLGQGDNIWVRKFDTNGIVLWTQTYNSPANVGDVGRCVAVDRAGNVYVGGYETLPDLGQGENTWIRKYDANGVVLWTLTYTGPAANGADRANGIAVDVSGNLYVAGNEDRSDLGQAGNIWVRKYRQ
ncbi:MAG: SBBP repeat-containing protein [Armatimonadetes bacterium]|nr:SBBP repeat-containing protein [Armatimonadota bacterium]